MSAFGVERTGKLTDDWTAPVSEHDRAAGLDDRWVLRAHDVRAQIKFAPRDADHGDQKRGDEPNRHDLEVGGSVRSVHRPVHKILSFAAVR